MPYHRVLFESFKKGFKEGKRESDRESIQKTATAGESLVSGKVH
jgi:hypothetical protein